jgi:hypothetical protein
LKLFDFLEGNSVKAEDLNHAVDMAQNIDHMKREKAQLEFDIDTLIDLKKWYEKGTRRNKKRILQNPLKPK